MRDIAILELYHGINSVCAQKVRIELVAKGLQAKEHIVSGDQLFTPGYLKLNPNAVVPTLVHDGVPVIESSVILYYLDEVFPTPPLMPVDSHPRARARLFNKLIDEYVHNYCTVISFATVWRPGIGACARRTAWKRPCSCAWARRTGHRSKSWASTPGLR